MIRNCYTVLPSSSSSIQIECSACNFLRTVPPPRCTGPKVDIYFILVCRFNTWFKSTSPMQQCRQCERGGWTGRYLISKTPKSKQTQPGSSLYASLEESMHAPAIWIAVAFFHRPLHRPMQVLGVSTRMLAYASLLCSGSVGASSPEWFVNKNNNNVYVCKARRASSAACDHLYWKSRGERTLNAPTRGTFHASTFCWRCCP